MAKWNPETTSWDFDDADLERALDAGDKATDQLASGTKAPVISSARYEPLGRRVSVELDNGATFAFPVDGVQGLRGVADADLHALEVWGTETLAWPTLDVHVGVPDLMAGYFGSGRWMKELQRERGRRGGRTPSTAKAAAARENGRKGGRPRKPAVS